MDVAEFVANSTRSWKKIIFFFVLLNQFNLFDEYDISRRSLDKFLVDFYTESKCRNRLHQLRRLLHSSDRLSPT